MPAADSTLYLLKLGETALLEEARLAEAEALLNEAFRSTARTLVQIAVALDEVERRRRSPPEVHPQPAPANTVPAHRGPPRPGSRSPRWRRTRGRL
jgi:hypothetical protein